MNMKLDMEKKMPATSAITMARGIFFIVLAVIAQILLYLDSICQRIATTSRLSKFAPKRYSSYDNTRVFNRVAVACLTVFTILYTVRYEYQSVVADIEVPVLGSGEAAVFGYYPPIGSNFHPKVPSYNVYSKYRPRTPLLIPFGRNESMIRQTVLSYIASGWPRADIIVVDNTGTMDANSLGHLTSSNPFYLDYDIFRRRYGISIIQTPSLLNFAQLQNFMLKIALGRNWPYYFWTHQDVAVLSPEEFKPYKSFYHRIIDVIDSSDVDQWSIKPPKQGLVMGGKLAATTGSGDRPGVFSGAFGRGSHVEAAYETKKTKRGVVSFGRKPKWGAKFFAYDYLSMVNVQAWRETGAWDPFIPYYNTDCDFYSRMDFAGYKVEEAQVGHLFDVAETIQDPEERFFPGSSAASRKHWGMTPQGQEPEGGQINSGRYRWLRAHLQATQNRKLDNENGRNSWQSSGLDSREKRMDGKPIWKKLQPWTYEPRGFQTAWWNAADAGRTQYIRKWGTVECDLRAQNKTMDDMWLLQYSDPESEVYIARKKQEEFFLAQMSARPIR
jgi:hypothetical protein